MKKKKLILSLIHDDLVSSKLVQGLNELGLQASPYLLHLGSTVFKLLEIEDKLLNERIYEHYLQLLCRAKHVHIEDTAALSKLAESIYTELLQLKPLISV